MKSEGHVADIQTIAYHVGFNFFIFKQSSWFFKIWFVSRGAWNCHYYIRMILYYLSVVFFLIMEASFCGWHPRPLLQLPPQALPVSLASGISSRNIGKGVFEHFSELQLPTIAMLWLLCKIDCAIVFLCHCFPDAFTNCWYTSLYFWTYLCISGVRLPW